VYRASSLDNERVVSQYIEQVINTGNLDAMEKFVADNVVDHYSPPDAPQGIKTFKRHLAAVLHTYGHFRLTIEDQIAEGDMVVTRVTVTGVRQNQWFGLRPSGKRITLTGINIDRVVDGKIVEHWGEADTVSAHIQMGAKIV
jgi:predicted ester cyclase